MGWVSRFLRAVLSGEGPAANSTTDSLYWNRRRGLHYYEVVEKWIEEHSPGDWILDVGARDTPIVRTGEFKRRSMLDIKEYENRFEGAELIVANWLEYDPGRRVDLILCLQVLEHLPDKIVAPFARKLLSNSKRAIISVPYKWPKGECKYHRQDPVDESKLIGWIGTEPLRSYVEKRDEKERLITLFEGV